MMVQIEKALVQQRKHGRNEILRRKTRISSICSSTAMSMRRLFSFVDFLSIFVCCSKYFETLKYEDETDLKCGLILFWAK